MIELLKNEWHVLSSAPLTFISFAIAIGGVSLMISSAFWGSIIAQDRSASDSRLEALRVELQAAKNAEADLKQRLGVFPRNSKFELLTNSELVRLSYELCNTIEDKATTWDNTHASRFGHFDTEARDALNAEYKSIISRLNSASADGNDDLIEELQGSDDYQAFRRGLDNLRDREDKRRRESANRELEAFASQFAELRLMRSEVASRLPDNFEKSIYGAVVRDDERAASELRYVDLSYNRPCAYSSRIVVFDMRCLAKALAARDDAMLPK